MFTRLPLIFVVIGALMGAHAQKSPRPDVPEKIQAPAGEEVVLVLHASGSQVYTCQQGSDGKYAWTLKAPEAELRDQSGTLVGKHFAGPTWRHNDGSEVTGKAAGRADAPDADAIPWLLVNVTGHSGNGVLSKVTSVQRIHTRGGQAPAAGCDAANNGSEKKVSYTADYYFYAPAN